jgi:alpha-L-fucosidase
MRFFCVAASLIVLVNAIPKPTAAQLAWQEDEIGVLIHFNMGTFTKPDGGWCSGTAQPPSSSIWDPKILDTDAWVTAMKALGAKYAVSPKVIDDNTSSHPRTYKHQVLTVKHCSGFCLYPTKVSFPFLPGPGGSYNFSVSEAPVKTDVAASFVASCKKKGVKPGFYYSLGSNAYTVAKLKLTVAQHDAVVLAQTKELWENYGPLNEIWCALNCVLVPPANSFGCIQV